MMNRLIGYQVPAPMLQGHVTDAATGQALIARVDVLEHTSTEIKPRLTQLPWGRFYRVLAAGSYQVQISKPGYETYEQTLVVNPQEPTNYEIELQPLPRWTVSGTTFLTSDDVTPVSCEVQFLDLIHDTLYSCQSDGEYSIELPTGEYFASTSHNDYVLAERTLQLYSDIESNFGLPDNVTLLTLPTNSLADWSSGGANSDWAVATDDSAGTHLVSNSTIYTHSEVDATLTLSDPVDLGSYHHASLHLRHYIDLEDELDYAEIQASSDGQQWSTLAHYSGHWGGYRDTEHSLDQFAGGLLHLRFHLVTDDWVNDQGWHINLITLRQSDQLNAVSPEDVQPEQFALLGNYPNPFNPSTTIEFHVPAHLSGKQPQLQVYNLRGAQVAIETGEPVTAGKARIQWQAGNDIASGIYFYQLQLGDQATEIGKMLFVK